MRHRTRISTERQPGQPVIPGDVTRAVQPRLAVEEPPVRQGEQTGEAPANEVPAGPAQRVERRVRSPLAIETRTFMPAPDGSPDTRRMVGVGEAVVFSSNRPAEWTIAGQAPPGRGRRREIIHNLNERGTQTIEARAGEETARVQIEVVEPSLRFSKTGEYEVPLSDGYGVHMELATRLTPLNASFSSIEVREMNVPAEGIWGYFEYSAQHGEPPHLHRANPSWDTVDGQNNVSGVDTAAFLMVPSRMVWPLSQGGFRWMIPNHYRVGGMERQFDTVPEAFEVNPAAGERGRGDFAGRVVLWKGGEEVERTY